MTDLLEHLRELQESRYCFMPGIVRDAADEIETLRQRVRELEANADDLKEKLSKECAASLRLMAELAALKQGQGQGQGQGEPVAVAHVGNRTFYVTSTPAQIDALGFHSDEEKGIPLYTSAPTIPVGYVLVPVEATYEMREAVRLATESEGLTTTAWQRNTICAAMLSAAQAKGRNEMIDITTQLRKLYVDTGSNYVQEAADEIEALRSKLERLRGALLTGASLLEQGCNATDMAGSMRRSATEQDKPLPLERRVMHNQHGDIDTGTNVRFMVENQSCWAGDLTGTLQYNGTDFVIDTEHSGRLTINKGYDVYWNTVQKIDA